MECILALDQGTTSSRALIIDHDGRIISSSQKEFKQHFPTPGFVEHDAKEIWSSQIAVAKDAIAKAADVKILAIGITNQRETTILWDKNTSEPIAPAIVWQDRRTFSYCEELKKKGYEKLVQEKTGLVLDPYFSATKIAWILDHIPGAREKAKRKELAFGTVDSWLLWNLTKGKVHCTDVTNASRTMLFNIHSLKWDEELLEIFNVPKEILPEVRSTSEIYGKTSLFSSPIPISGIAGDQQAALFGQGCFDLGSVKATYGTGCFLLMNTGQTPILSEKRLLTTIAWKIGKETTYALEGSVFMAGAIVQWLRDNLGMIEHSSDVDVLAGKVADSNGVIFVPAFTGLGAPYWDPYAKGLIFGLTRGTEKGHIARSALEGIAFQAADVLNAMVKDAKLPIKEIRADGGSAVSDILLQFQADLLQRELLRPKTHELTGLGAGFLAGLAIGFWKSKEEILKIWHLERKFHPQIAPKIVEKLLKKWERAVLAARSLEDRS